MEETAANATPVQGHASLEHLTHFRCGRCHKWWSIGDAPRERRTWFCPWCGQEQTVDFEPEPDCRAGW